MHYGKSATIRKGKYQSRHGATPRSIHLQSFRQQCQMAVFAGRHCSWQEFVVGNSDYPAGEHLSRFLHGNSAFAAYRGIRPEKPKVLRLFRQIIAMTSCRWGRLDHDEMVGRLNRVLHGWAN
jgi:hypothetical protein